MHIVWWKLALLTWTMMITATLMADPPRPLDEKQVGAFARLALRGIAKEYPNKPSNVMSGPEDALSPRKMHPAFFGCFDWHSSVHGHWMLARLLRLYPSHPVAPEMEALLDKQLTAENLREEAAYFEPRENRSFERMYGWAWALRLVAELHAWDDPRARRWRENARPLEATLVRLTKDYLPKLTWPIRSGVHQDTAFAFGQILDYARVVEERELAALLEKRARKFHLADRDYPAAYEPSGEDFFSAGLNEADLMRRVLPREEFGPWLGRFLPSLTQGEPSPMLTPVEVSDVTDGKLVHLAGLNLSRAWTMWGVASALPEEDPRRSTLSLAAEKHAQAGLRYVSSGHYEGEHWLATFAVYALTGSGRGG